LKLAQDSIIDKCIPSWGIRDRTFKSYHADQKSQRKAATQGCFFVAVIYQWYKSGIEKLKILIFGKNELLESR